MPLERSELEPEVSRLPLPLAEPETLPEPEIDPSWLEEEPDVALPVPPNALDCEVWFPLVSELLLLTEPEALELLERLTSDEAAPLPLSEVSRLPLADVEPPAPPTPEVLIEVLLYWL